MTKSSISAKLDWNRLLGFEQVAEDRVSDEADLAGTKVGSKLGQKVGVKLGQKIGVKLGVKLGMKSGS